MRVVFNVTGFGPFGGVAVNPSSALVNGLTKYFQIKGLPSDASLGICRVLETSGIDSLTALHELRTQHHNASNTTNNSNNSNHSNNNNNNHNRLETDQKTAPNQAQANDVITVWLHFGVHGGAKAFHLETTAYNVADFRIPDNRGWSPINECIIDRAPAQLTTAIPIDTLCKQLANQWKVQPSDDPGRFVCNWVYFNSLFHCQHGGICSSDGTPTPCHNIFSIFVHVPPSTIYNESSQLAFAHDLISCITQLLQPSQQQPHQQQQQPQQPQQQQQKQQPRPQQ